MSRIPEDTIRTPGVVIKGSGLSSECCLSVLNTAEHVTHVSAGVNHCAVVCTSGRAYSLGHVSCHLATVRVVNSACGYLTTFFVTDMGEVYACGVNDQGQLGVGNTANCSTPTLVPKLPPVTKIVAGYKHTVALTREGEVWVSGRNEEGQCGLGLCKRRVTFGKVLNVRRVIDVACGRWHTVLLTDLKHLMVSGWNHYRQLDSSTNCKVSRFQLTSLFCRRMAAIACGSNHTVALGVDGMVRAWGWNEDGQLGNGKFTYFSTAEKIVGLEGIKITRIFAGGNRMALLTEDGEMLVCGRGMSREPDIEVNNSPRPTLWPKSSHLRVEHMAFGPEYCILLVKREEGETLDGNGETLEDSITALERSNLKCLECPVCFKVMHDQIHLCINGHSLCGSCHSKLEVAVCPKCRGKFVHGKNVALQTLASEISLPCMDCLKRMPVTSLEQHASFCPKRIYQCPLEDYCTWTGQPGTVLAHAKSTHAHKIQLFLPTIFTHTTLACNAIEHRDLIGAFNEIFLLRRRYNQGRGEVRIFLQYIGLPEHAEKFRLRADFCINSDTWNVTFYKEVAPDGATIEEMLHIDYCVLMKINRDYKFSNNEFHCKINVLKTDKN